MNNSWFSIEQIQDRVWGISEPGHFEDVRSYLIVGNKRALLIDSGMGIGNIKEAVSSITSKPITVINTHMHFDHMGGNALFARVIILDHLSAVERASKGYTQEEIAPYSGASLFLRACPAEFNPNTWSIQSFRFQEIVTNGASISIAPYVFRVIHTPGHSSDSLCLYEERLKWLFAGDTIYPGPIYVHLKDSNKELYGKSLKKLSSLTIHALFPGHNAFTYNPDIVQSIHKAINRKRIENTIIVDGKTRIVMQEV